MDTRLREEFRLDPDTQQITVRLVDGDVVHVEFGELDGIADSVAQEIVAQDEKDDGKEKKRKALIKWL
ncbi:MAG: hypothetical protein ACR2N0_02275 [Rubrobacteraceae bacterium]